MSERFAQEKLRQSEEKFRNLFENANVAIGLSTNEGIIVDANKEFQNLLGYTKHELMNKTVLDITMPEDQEFESELFNLKGKKRPSNYRYKKRYITKDKKIKWIDLSVFPLNTISERNELIYAGVAVDITEEMEFNERLQESENKYKALFENALVAQFRFSLDTEKVIAANKVAADLFGYKSASHFIREFKAENHYVNLEDRATLLNQLEAKKHIERIMMHSKKLDGTNIWNESSFRIDPSGNFVDCFSVDSTNEVILQNELKISTIKLRNLTRHLNNMREEERKEISREIHDDLGQALTSLKLDLSWIQKKGKIENGDLLSKIDEMKNTVDKTTSAIQKISMELRPGLLDELGLVYAVRWQCEQFASRSDIKCNVHIDPEDLNVEENIGVELFRILQESLTNVARHSKATDVNISLIKNRNLIQLNISDNGIGITEDDIEDQNSLGLLGINERVRAIGGKISISGNKNKGTEISVEVKLTEEK